MTKEKIVKALKSKLENAKMIVDIDGECTESTLYQLIEHMVSDMFSEGEQIFLDDKSLIQDVEVIDNYEMFRSVYEKWFSNELLFDLDEVSK